MWPGEVQSSLALRSAFRIFGFAQDRMRFGIALNKNFDFLRLCSHLSLSLAVAQDRMRFGKAYSIKLDMLFSHLSLSLYNC